MKDVRKTWIVIQKMKFTVSMLKNSLAGINRRLTLPGEQMGKSKARAIVTIQNKIHSRKKMNKNK